MNTLLVTNTNDSGEGSLRWAIEQANAYQGEDGSQITFDSTLAGQTINLASITLSKKTSITNLSSNGVIINGVIESSFYVILNNVICNNISLLGNAMLSGNGNFITNKECIILRNWSGDVQSISEQFQFSSPYLDAYISIEGIKKSVELVPIDNLVNTYTFYCAYKIENGVEFSLSNIVLNSRYFYHGLFGWLLSDKIEVDGKLSASGTTINANVQISDSGVFSLDDVIYNGRLYIYGDGVISGNDVEFVNKEIMILDDYSGKISEKLSNLTFDFSDSESYFTINNLVGDAELSVLSNGMNHYTFGNGIIHVKNNQTLTIASGVKVSVYEGTQGAAGGRLFDYGLCVSGTLVANEVTFFSYIVLGGNAKLLGTKNYFESSYLSGGRIFGLKDWSGNVASAVNSFDFKTDKSDLHVLVYSITGNSEFDVLNEKISDYRFIASIAVPKNISLVINSGVSISSESVYNGWLWNDYYFNVEGIVHAAESVFKTDFILSGSGRAVLDSCYINVLKTASNSELVANDCTFNGTTILGGTVGVVNGLMENIFNIDYSGKVNITKSIIRGKGVGVSGSLVIEESSIDAPLTVNSSGNFSATNTKFAGNVTVSSGGKINLMGVSGIKNLNLSLQSTTKISGNNFSNTTISLIDSGVVDLSGNYWGTTDIDEIISKIKGYDPTKVIVENWLMVDPTTNFTYLGTSLPYNRIGQGVDRLEILLSHDIDVSTVTRERVKLVNKSGQELAYKGISISGSTIVVTFDPFVKEDTYQLVLDAGILDVAGNSLINASGNSYYASLKVQLSAPRVSHFEPGGDFTGTLTELLVYFTDTMDVNSLYQGIQITSPDGKKINISRIEDLGGNVYKLSISPQTAYGSYNVAIGTGVVNLAGNRLNQNGNEIYGEADDVYVGSFAIADVDLTITDVQVSRALKAGDLVTIAWNGKNATGYELKGKWTDGVYLSKDGRWDINDIFLGSVDHLDGLAAGASYNGELSLSLPGVLPGSYYILVRSDIHGQEAVNKESYEWVQNLEAVQVNVGIQQLSLGDTLHGSVGKKDSFDYYVIKQGSSTATKVNLKGLDSGEMVEVYVAYGRIATREDYDYSFKTTNQQNSLLLKSNAAYQDVYIMVNYKGGAESVSYSLTSEAASMEITAVMAHSKNVGNEGVFDIYGVNLKQDSSILFIDSHGREYSPNSVEWISPDRIRVIFGENSLPADQLDVKITAGSENYTAKQAVTMTSRSGDLFLIDVKAPLQLGYHVIANFTVSYENAGYDPCDAPLVIFTITQNGESKGFLTLDESLVNQGFWTSGSPEGFSDSVSFLATGSNGGILLPTGRFEHLLSASYSEGTSSSAIAEYIANKNNKLVLENSMEVYYTGWQQPWDFSYPQFDINVSYITSGNTALLDWNDIVADLDFDDTVKGLIADSLGNLTGTTWGDYVKSLNEILSHQDSLGLSTKGVSEDDMLAFKIMQAIGKIGPVSSLSSSTDMAVQTTGLALSVSRVYRNDMVSHNEESSFGYGWTSSWDISLDIQSDGDVVLNMPGASLIYQKSHLGGYINTTGNDDSQLTKNRDGSYTVSVVSSRLIYSFSAEGALQRVLDANNNSISCSYNGEGKLVKLTHSNGEWISYEYNVEGYISRLTGSHGLVTSYAYEGGNLIASTNSFGDTMGYSYSDSLDHFLSSIRGADGTRQEFTYNEGGVLKESSATSSNGEEAGYGKVSLSYGRDGSVIVTDVYGASTSYYYDLSGRVRKALDVNGSTVRYGYDDKGKLIWVTDQMGNTTSYSYDNKGNMISVTNALGNTTAYSYTDAGQLNIVTDSNGNRIEYAYDAKGNTVSITYADGSAEFWTYDSVGNISSWTSRSGQTLLMSYDSRGNLLSRTYEDGVASSFTYDGVGNLLTASDHTGTTTYTYDARFRVTRIDYPKGHSLVYAYDSYDRRVSMTDEAGNATLYEYDAWGALSKVKDGDGNLIVSYEYDRGGRLVREEKGNGTYTTYQYTLSGDVSEIKHYSPTGEATAFCSYEYNAVGLKISMETETGKWTYRYDVIGQLVQANFVPGANSDLSSQDIRYEYDAVGNRTRTWVNGVETTYRNNELNQVVSANDVQYIYDIDGNLIQKTDDSGITYYEWNADGKLVKLTSSSGDIHEYVYNSFGDRVSTTINGKTTEYVYDPSGYGNLVAEYDSTGERSKGYYHGQGLIGYDDAVNGTYWYQGDALTSVTGITDSSGNLVATYQYDPFGSLLSSTGSLDNMFTWIGGLGLVDDGEGMTYMRARYYDSKTGTFISPDPIGISGGLNLYAYCLNNVLNFVDESGLGFKATRDLNIQFDILGMPVSLGGAVKNFVNRKTLGFGYLTQGFLNLNPKHEFYKCADGTTIGYSKECGVSFGSEKDSPGVPGYQLEKYYTIQDKYIIEAAEVLKESIEWKGGNYNLLTHNCQNFVDALIKEAKRRQDLENAVCYPTDSAGSYDPNDLTGTRGYGEENYIAAGSKVTFLLQFENEEDATAPARWIRLSTVFDDAYDLDTFTLGSIYLAGNLINVSGERDSFNQRVTMSFEGKEVLVDIAINLDYETRELKASFMAVDPQTGTMLQDLMTGMLYPNNETGRGDGYVTYSIGTRKELTTETVINNAADIYFDFNEVIPTPELNYTIDSGLPESRMLSAADSGTGGEVTLTWKGLDAAGGSGLAGYYVFVSKDGGVFELWKSFGADVTSATFSGLMGSTYGFFVQSIDNVGNVETDKQAAEVIVKPSSSDVTPPDPVTGLKAASQGGVTVFAWKAVDDPSGVSYVLEYADNVAWNDSKQRTVTDNYASVEGLTDGTWYWRVKAVDGVGNESAWTQADPLVVDASTPDVPVESLRAEAHGTAAKLSWAAVTDPAGIAGYLVQYALNDKFDSASTKQVQGTEFIDFDLAGNATYYWRVAAVDKLGNVGAWAEGTPFLTTVAVDDNSPLKATELKLTEACTASASEWVGFGDKADYFKAKPTAAGAYWIGVEGESLGTSVYLSVGTLDKDGAFSAERVLAVGQGSSLSGLDGVALEAGRDYYIRVSSYDNGAGLCNGSYTLNVKGTLPVSVTDNNSREKASALSLDDRGDAAVKGWVGCGDATDFYRFELFDSGSVALKLSDMQMASRLTIFRENEKGGLTQVSARAVRSSGMEAALNLLAGTYYVQVSSYDGGAGRYNTGYMLDIDAGEQTRRSGYLAAL